MTLTPDDELAMHLSGRKLRCTSADLDGLRQRGITEAAIEKHCILDETVHEVKDSLTASIGQPLFRGNRHQRRKQQALARTEIRR